MDIRKIRTEKEAEAILEFLYSENAFFWPIDELEKASMKRNVFGAISDDEKSGWFSQDGGHVVAAGTVRVSETPGVYFISWLAVHKDYRKRGLGKLIVQKAEEFARSKNARVLILYTGENNIHGRPFYKKLGFIEVGIISDYYKEGIGRVSLYKSLLSKTNPLK